MGAGGTLLLDTVGGAEDFLLEEISTLGTATLTEAGVVDLASDAGWSTLFADLRDRDFYSGVRVRIADEQLERLLPRLTTSMTVLGVDGPAGFRVDVPSAEERRAVSTRIAAISGWSEAPGDWMINIQPDGTDFLVDIGPLHWSRRHHRLERLPWSTPVVVAEVLVRLAKVRADDRLLDPCCGAGTNLVAAGLAGVTTLIGVDHDPTAVETSRTNLDRSGLAGDVRLGSAAELDLGSGSVDRVIANLPFGKQVGSHGSNQQLYPALLGQIARCLAPGGRAVLLTEDKNLFAETVQRTSGLKIIKQRLLRYSGASPTAYVITGTTPKRRRR